MEEGRREEGESERQRRDRERNGTREGTGRSGTYRKEGKRREEGGIYEVIIPHSLLFKVLCYHVCVQVRSINQTTNQSIGRSVSQLNTKTKCCMSLRTERSTRKKFIPNKTNNRNNAT